MLKRISLFVRRHDWFAVGIEIMVVMIGLLLAFQLDRWRDNRVERDEERIYVHRLIADLETDLPQIEKAIKLAELRLELVDFLIEVAHEPQTALTMPTLFMGAVSQAAFTYTPQLTSHTFENLRSTGDLKLIRNEDLKAALFNYYGFDADQRQYLPLHFDTEHRHFELGAGILSLEQERFIQENWFIFQPDDMDGLRNESPEVRGVLEAAKRLQNRPTFIAWLPYVRQVQREQFDVNTIRLELAEDVLESLRVYAAEIDRQ